VTDRPGLVLDAGAFIQLERRDRAMFALARTLVETCTPLITSVGVVAQVWRGGDGRQVSITRLLRYTKVVELTYPVAKLLGRMLGLTGATDPVDAHVVFLARERKWPVLTSDPDDLLAIDPGLVVETI
jgi:hypothetical protein